MDTEKVEQVLNEDPDITLIAMVYHETSSGMLNPAEKTGELAEIAILGQLFREDVTSSQDILIRIHEIS